MARFFVLMLSMFFLVACGLSPNLPEGTASQEAAQNPGVTKSEPSQQPVRQDQEREKEEVLAAAKAYMERQGGSPLRFRRFRVLCRTGPAAGN